MKHENFTNVVHATEAAREFIGQHFAVQRSDDQVGMLQLIKGVPVGAVLYEQYNGTNIWVHAAGTPGKPWLTRQLIHNFFDYPFNQLGCDRITAWVEDTNSASKHFVERLGFKLEAVLKGAGVSGVDAKIYVMFREDCRYA